MNIIVHGLCRVHILYAARAKCRTVELIEIFRKFNKPEPRVRLLL